MADKSLNMKDDLVISTSSEEYNSWIDKFASGDIEITDKICEEAQKRIPISIFQNIRKLKGKFGKFRLTKIGIGIIATHCQNLEELDLENCRGIGDDSLKIIGEKLNKLRILNLYKCIEITSNGFLYISKLSNLEELNINYCHRIGNKFSKEVFKHLKLLKVLKLGGTQRMGSALNNKTMKCIQKYCQNLIELSIYQCPFLNDEGVEYISKIKTLQTFSISHCNNITPYGLDKLILRCLKLHTISIRNSSRNKYCIDDRYLGNIKSHPNLQNIKLWNCDNVTDDGLIKLIKMKQLRFIEFAYCDNITYRGVWTLAYSLSHVQIIVNNCHKLKGRKFGLKNCTIYNETINSKKS